MKLVMGSTPGNRWPVQLSRGAQKNCGSASAGVSFTKSPGWEQPPANVWYRPSQWPTSWVPVSPWS